MDQILEKPHLLRILQLHGCIPEIITHLLQLLMHLLSQSTFSVQLHSDFSKVFGLLFNIILRFDIINNQKNREFFINELKNELNKTQNQKDTIILFKEWIFAFLHNTTFPKLEEIGDEILSTLLQQNNQR